MNIFYWSLPLDEYIFSAPDLKPVVPIVTPGIDTVKDETVISEEEVIEVVEPEAVLATVPVEPVKGTSDKVSSNYSRLF